MGKKPNNKQYSTTIVTPDRSRNLYSALAEAEESIQTEEDFLPNTISSKTSTPTDDNNDTDTEMEESTTTKGFNKDTDLTKAKLITIMGEIQPDCMTPTENFTYTDLMEFQLLMGDALSRVPAKFMNYGYSYIADTETTYLN